MDCYSSTAADPAECVDPPVFIKACVMMMMIMVMMMMMMMVLCLKAGSMAFMPPGDEMSEVVSCCLPHRQLWVSNLSKVATRWLEVDSNLQPSGCKAQNIPLHCCV